MSTTLTPDQLSKESNASESAQFVLLVIAEHLLRTNALPGIKTIADHAQMSIAEVIDAIRDLEAREEILLTQNDTRISYLEATASV